MTVQIGPNQVYRLDLGMVNAYLVDDGDVTLIDTGTPSATDDIRTELDRAGYDEEDIDRILITHFDLDHVGIIAHLDVEVPIYAMEPDASYLDGSRKPPLSNHKGILQRVMNLRITRPDRSIQRIEDGDTVDGFTAYHTPGHTPGHAIYVHEEYRLGLLGDLVAEDDGELTTSPWILTYSTTQNASSIQALAGRDLPIDIVAMGHGNPITTDGAAALDELAEHLD